MTTARASGRRRGSAAGQPQVPSVVPDLDARIAEAEAGAVVMWRGEAVPFAEVPARVAGISARVARNRLFEAYHQAIEATNELREQRVRAWRGRLGEGGEADGGELTAALGFDPAALRVDLQPFRAHTETPYFAALRRYLALIDIEQGDATLADLWHLRQGSGWSAWFEERRVAQALKATLAQAPGVEVPPLDGAATGAASWLAGADGLRQAGAAAAGTGTRAARVPIAAAAIEELFAQLLADAGWLSDALGMAREEIAAFADFVAFERLWRMQHDLALLTYELRMHATPQPLLWRAYYAGIVGTMTGLVVPEAGYLAAVATPFASAERLMAQMLASMLGASMAGGGRAWWREGRSVAVLRRVAGAPSVDAALAILGYDALDWRPVLRQIRTQLIGEMSGYGGPNITTRAGTRKV